jgi:hypothetical protein
MIITAQEIITFQEEMARLTVAMVMVKAETETVEMVPVTVTVTTMIMEAATMVAMDKATTVMAMAIRMHPETVVAITMERILITVVMETVVMGEATTEMATVTMVAEGTFRMQMVQARTREVHTGLSPSVPRTELLRREVTTLATRTRVPAQVQM